MTPQPARNDHIAIAAYRPSDQDAFARLNTAWLERYFVVEPFDREVLGNPDRLIIEPGGAILIAHDGPQAIGAGALIHLGPDPDHPGAPLFEISKMAVDDAYQGCGIGRRMLEMLAETARLRGSRRVMIYSNTCLAPAIGLYRSAGFVEIPVSAADRASRRARARR